jgi:peptidoglycan/LPS O-acetylase OafA/YrhL
LLATYVLLGHSRWLLWAGHSAWLNQSHSAWEVPLAYGSAALRYGNDAVMVFFVLSGFFIHLRMAQKITMGTNTRLDFADFYRRRAHRLVTPYVLALALTVILDAVGHHFYPTLYDAHTGDNLLDSNFARKGYTAVSVVPALFLLPTSLGSDFGTNGPLWSLAFEVVYYLVYPTWLLLRRRGAILAYAGVTFVCLALILSPKQNFLTIVGVHYPVWLAGAALAEFLSNRPAITINPVLAIALLLAALAARLLVNVPTATVLLSIVFGSAAVLTFASLPNGVSTRRWHRILEALGLRSYTIYITHFPILAFMSAWAFSALGGRPFSGWLAMGGAGIAIGLCWLSFEVCEKHFLHPRIRAVALTK